MGNTAAAPLVLELRLSRPTNLRAPPDAEGRPREVFAKVGSVFEPKECRRVDWHRGITLSLASEQAVVLIRLFGEPALQTGEADSLADATPDSKEAPPVQLAELTVSYAELLERGLHEDGEPLQLHLTFVPGLKRSPSLFNRKGARTCDAMGMEANSAEPGGLLTDRPSISVWVRRVPPALAVLGLEPQLPNAGDLKLALKREIADCLAAERRLERQLADLGDGQGGLAGRVSELEGHLVSDVLTRVNFVEAELQRVRQALSAESAARQTDWDQQRAFVEGMVAQALARHSEAQTAERADLHGRLDDLERSLGSTAASSSMQLEATGRQLADLAAAQAAAQRRLEQLERMVEAELIDSPVRRDRAPSIHVPVDDARLTLLQDRLHELEIALGEANARHTDLASSVDACRAGQDQLVVELKLQAAGSEREADRRQQQLSALDSKLELLQAAAAEERAARECQGATLDALAADLVAAAATEEQRVTSLGDRITSLDAAVAETREALRERLARLEHHFDEASARHGADLQGGLAAAAAELRRLEDTWSTLAASTTERLEAVERNVHDLSILQTTEAHSLQAVRLQVEQLQGQASEQQNRLEALDEGHASCQKHLETHSQEQGDLLRHVEQMKVLLEAERDAREGVCNTLNDRLVEECRGREEREEELEDRLAQMQQSISHAINLQEERIADHGTQLEQVRLDVGTLEAALIERTDGAAKTLEELAETQSEQAAAVQTHLEHLSGRLEEEWTARQSLGQDFAQERQARQEYDTKMQDQLHHLQTSLSEVLERQREVQGGDLESLKEAQANCLQQITSCEASLVARIDAIAKAQEDHAATQPGFLEQVHSRLNEERAARETLCSALDGKLEALKQEQSDCRSHLTERADAAARSWQDLVDAQSREAASFLRQLGELKSQVAEERGSREGAYGVLVDRLAQERQVREERQVKLEDRIGQAQSSLSDTLEKQARAAQARERQAQEQRLRDLAEEVAGDRRSREDQQRALAEASDKQARELSQALAQAQQLQSRVAACEVLATDVEGLKQAHSSSAKMRDAREATMTERLEVVERSVREVGQKQVQETASAQSKLDQLQRRVVQEHSATEGVCTSLGERLTKERQAREELQALYEERLGQVETSLSRSMERIERELQQQCGSVDNRLSALQQRLTDELAEVGELLARERQLQTHQLQALSEAVNGERYSREARERAMQAQLAEERRVREAHEAVLRGVEAKLLAERAERGSQLSHVQEAIGQGLAQERQAREDQLAALEAKITAEHEGRQASEESLHGLFAENRAGLAELQTIVGEERKARLEGLSGEAAERQARELESVRAGLAAAAERFRGSVGERLTKAKQTREEYQVLLDERISQLEARFNEATQKQAQELQQKLAKEVEELAARLTQEGQQQDERLRSLVSEVTDTERRQRAEQEAALREQLAQERQAREAGESAVQVMHQQLAGETADRSRQQKLVQELITQERQAREAQLEALDRALQAEREDRQGAEERQRARFAEERAAREELLSSLDWRLANAKGGASDGVEKQVEDLQARLGDVEGRFAAIDQRFAEFAGVEERLFKDTAAHQQQLQMLTEAVDSQRLAQEAHERAIQGQLGWSGMVQQRLQDDLADISDRFTRERQQAEQQLRELSETVASESRARSTTEQAFRMAADAQTRLVSQVCERAEQLDSRVQGFSTRLDGFGQDVLGFRKAEEALGQRLDSAAQAAGEAGRLAAEQGAALGEIRTQLPQLQAGLAQLEARLGDALEAAEARVRKVEAECIPELEARLADTFEVRVQALEVGALDRRLTSELGELRGQVRATLEAVDGLLQQERQVREAKDSALEAAIAGDREASEEKLRSATAEERAALGDLEGKLAQDRVELDARFEALEARIEQLQCAMAESDSAGGDQRESLRLADAVRYHTPDFIQQLAEDARARAEAGPSGSMSARGGAPAMVVSPKGPMNRPPPVVGTPSAPGPLWNGSPPSSLSFGTPTSAPGTSPKAPSRVLSFVASAPRLTPRQPESARRLPGARKE